MEMSLHQDEDGQDFQNSKELIPHRFASGWNWDHRFGSDLPLEMWQTVYTHDGVPSHSSHFGMRYLNSHFPSQQVGRNGPVVWAPWWRHLTPANFNLWDFVKTIIYSEQCEVQSELWNAIEAAGTTVCSITWSLSLDHEFLAHQGTFMYWL